MKPRIYTIATSHLDTSWNWTLETTLNEYLPRTAAENFPLFEKFPEYKFSFEGSCRYELMEEYYPEYFEKIQDYAAKGRWFPAGSAYENGDVNIPSPEAIFRNILYGNAYFEQKLGRRSRDIFLPDCFGFGFALPSIARHAGLIGFTTQKLTWSSWCGVPFDLGKWYGVDGSFIYASFDTGGYQRSFKKSVRGHYAAARKLESNNRKFGLPMTALFHGVGDRGGAPRQESVSTVVRELRENPRQRSDVLSASSDEMFTDMDTLLTEEQKRHLPVYTGELVSTNHGAGGYTSRTQSKRLNRRGELLCEAAERFSVGAFLLTGRPVNTERLDRCWKRLIAHQFHDDITGTSLLDCYKRNWNDYFLTLNEASQEYAAAVGTLAGQIDASGLQGIPVAVANPLQFARFECVCLELNVPDTPALRVFDRVGNEVPSTVTKRADGVFLIRFEINVKGLSVTVFDIRPSNTPCAMESPLKASADKLENARIAVRIDENGDICGIYDKALRRELLSAPIRFDVLDYEGTYGYAAWEVNFSEISAPPKRRTTLTGIELTDNGAAAATLKITKTCGDSRFTQEITLSAGAKTVSVYNEIDWRSPMTLLKARFPFTASDDKALYDLGLGVIERPNNTKKRYEVPAQMWAAVADRSGAFCAYALSDSRVGWDKPDDRTIRLTLMHSPRHAYRAESAQHLLDFGLNRFSFAVGAIEGRDTAGIQREALCFNSPLAAFSSDVHKGVHGGCISFGSLSDDRVLLRALKPALCTDELVVRVNEGAGEPVDKARLSLAVPILSAREANASEEALAPAEVKDGELVFSLGSFGVKTFLIKTETAANTLSQILVPLPYNAAVVSGNDGRKGVKELSGMTLPREQFPQTVTVGNTLFMMPRGEENACVCAGQEIALPGGCDTLYLLAGAVKNDTEACFMLNDRDIRLSVASLFEPVGAWDIYARFETGYVKNDSAAYVFTHMHREGADVRGKQAVLFWYQLNTDGAKTLTLPNNPDILIFAASADGRFQTEPLTALYDRLEKRPCDFVRTPEQDKAQAITKWQGKKGRADFLVNYISRQLRREKDMI